MENEMESGIIIKWLIGNMSYCQYQGYQGTTNIIKGGHIIKGKVDRSSNDVPPSMYPGAGEPNSVAALCRSFFEGFLPRISL